MIFLKSRFSVSQYGFLYDWLNYSQVSDLSAHRTQFGSHTYQLFKMLPRPCCRGIFHYRFFRLLTFESNRKALHESSFELSELVMLTSYEDPMTGGKHCGLVSSSFFLSCSSSFLYIVLFLRILSVPSFFFFSMFFSFSLSFYFCLIVSLLTWWTSFSLT